MRLCRLSWSGTFFEISIPPDGSFTSQNPQVFSSGWGLLLLRPLLGMSTREKYANVLVPVPPLTQQRAIADYLDRETERLDALVATKERVLGLLAEKRRALITRAVTRGLDHRAPLRDSGIPWLGEIPEKWDTRRLAGYSANATNAGSRTFRCYEVSINAGVAVREFSDDRIENTAADFNTYKVARQGDVVFNKMRMWQGAVGVAPQDGLVSPDYVVAAPTGSLLPQYAGLLFRIDKFTRRVCKTITRYRLGPLTALLGRLPRHQFTPPPH